MINETKDHIVTTSVLIFSLNQPLTWLGSRATLSRSATRIGIWTNIPLLRQQAEIWNLTWFVLPQSCNTCTLNTQQQQPKHTNVDMLHAICFNNFQISIPTPTKDTSHTNSAWLWFFRSVLSSRRCRKITWSIQISFLLLCFTPNLLFCRHILYVPLMIIHPGLIPEYSDVFKPELRQQHNFQIPTSQTTETSYCKISVHKPLHFIWSLSLMVTDVYLFEHNHLAIALSHFQYKWYHKLHMNNMLALIIMHYQFDKRKNMKQSITKLQLLNCTRSISL